MQSEPTSTAKAANLSNVLKCFSKLNDLATSDNIFYSNGKRDHPNTNRWMGRENRLICVWVGNSTMLCHELRRSSFPPKYKRTAGGGM